MKIKEEDIAKLLISSSPEGILIVNQQGEIVLVNASILKMFRYSEKELIGQKMEILIPSKYSEKHVNHRKEFAINPSKRRMGGDRVLYAKRKDNSEFAVEIGLNHLQTEDGILISALLTDVSERVVIQEKLSELNAQLEGKVIERTQELENAILELQETNSNLEVQYDKTKKAEDEVKVALEKEKKLGELKSRFVSMASHEFRTPLSTVLTSNSLIQKYLDKIENLDPPIREKFNKHNSKIINSIKNLNNILNDLLSLGKIEEGKIDIKKNVFLITDLFDELNEEMVAYIKPNQTIKISHSGNETINTDRHILHNVLINLTTNASKYSKEGKPIRIESLNENNVLTINIIDEGIGIPEEDNEYMFDRFFRAKNVTNIQGTGLGLNIVKKYLELINGDITFKSELNVGSVFTVKINLI